MTYSWDSPDLAGQIASGLGSLLVFIGVCRAIAFAGLTGAALRPWTRSGLPASRRCRRCRQQRVKLLLAGERDRIAQGSA